MRLADPHAHAGKVRANLSTAHLRGSSDVDRAVDRLPAVSQASVQDS